jgi:hypothetical protein
MRITDIAKKLAETRVKQEYKQFQLGTSREWEKHKAKVDALPSDYVKVFKSALNKAPGSYRIIETNQASVIEIQLLSSEKPFRTTLEITEHIEDPTKDTARYFAVNPENDAIYIRDLMPIMNTDSEIS